MRKTVFLMLMICLIAVAVPVRGEPQITGNSAVLLDARSGQVLFEKDKDLVLPPRQHDENTDSYHGHRKRQA